MGGNSKGKPEYKFDTKPNDDKEFDDPVLRCDSCQALVKRKSLHRSGACPKCGNKRVRALDVFNKEEEAQIKEWGFHDFLKEFEVAPDE